MARTDNSIVYSGDIVIKDEADLATLCVFYDRIYLPHVATMLTTVRSTLSGSAINNVVRWDEANRILFGEKILVRLDLPTAISRIGRTASIVTPEDIIKDETRQMYNGYLTLSLRHNERGTLRDEQRLVNSFANRAVTIAGLVIHRSRLDLTQPELFSKNSLVDEFEVNTFALARKVMTYLLPMLDSLSPDDIMTVRHAVADTRLGFASHLEKLSKGVDELLKENAPTTEIERWATSLIYHDLQPDYIEFRSQLEAGKSWLDKTGRIFEISASPWTPKFWGDLLRALGVPLRTAAEQVERRSNKSQAFQFMQAVEESKVARYQRGQ